MIENFEAAIQLNNIKKEYKNFALNIPSLTIPEGFATALIGENGAGKTTLLKILTGLKKDFSGDISYFGGETDKDVILESIGYTSSTCYFNPAWKLDNIAGFSPFIYSTFNADTFFKLCYKMDLYDKKVTIENMSDGMKMKASLAATLARDTKLLVLDEPASPLDPIMRNTLCDLIRDYLQNGNGNRSVLFSTHNISDMENVTDYAIIMEHGEVVEQGFVEDLKEKYLLVKGEPKEAHKLGRYLIGFTKNEYTCEGLCLAENIDKLAGLNIAIESPTLNQISVGIMKAHSILQ